MTQSYAASFLKQQEIREGFKFYFKQANFRNDLLEDHTQLLEALVRPRLRIAIITETWPPEVNGVAFSLAHLCKGLQQLGHKILLIRPIQKVTYEAFKPNKECLVRPHKIPKYQQLQFGWPQYFKVASAIEEFSPQVVHIVTEGPLGLVALQVAKSKKIPISSGFHSPFQDLSRFFDLAMLVKPIQKYLRWFHNSTQITCVPSKDTENALRQFGVTCPLRVVEGGVDVNVFHPQHRSIQLRRKWGVNDVTTVLLYVGRLSPEKEISVLIKSYQAMLNSGQQVKLVIVGDGPEREHLVKMDEKNQIIFTGVLTGKDLASAYASADVFIFPSQVETFGNVVLEAMASGLPIVAYDYACANLHVSHGTMGWLIPLGSVDKFMLQIYQLPEKSVLNEMGQQARTKVQTVSWQRPVQQFEDALYDATKENVMTA
ncbi:glycosyl transferase [Acinetobacter sp. ANC 4558]|uniref:glycosyltransferase family 4 protein n=1 Tax=Acinetobacter sp. ANC 4558 TaxID=1977876 RepID=UPI000A35289D|nr:glycosyltransferase family 1 protein [Acinetobacter sp. ANC 4558]OTG86613.1 glycosyl transferase [Acinetobacter sp. ANC 4558]